MRAFGKSIKIALAALLAILIAAELGLQSTATAGIITILSIGNTKRETLRSALNRGVAFLCALVLSGVCFYVAGFSIWAFAVYLFLFALLCLLAGWGEAIAMDSVLISHFLAAGNMGTELLVNELLLFAIGTGMGIAVNLHLHPKADEYDRLAEEVDRQIRGILRRMAEWLQREDKTAYNADCFVQLKDTLEEAARCAIANHKNSFLDKYKYGPEYIAMREQQYYVLREIYDNIIRIHSLPMTIRQVAGILERIEEDFHRDNNVQALLLELEQLLEDMKTKPLPESREEFEDRAILFYILKQLERFLELKHDYCKASNCYDRLYM